MAQTRWAVGLMTGTALDGNIDVALLGTDGQRIDAFGPCSLVRYESRTLELLHQCQQHALQWQFNGPEPALFAEVEEQLTREQSNAVKQVLADHAVSLEDVEVVGFHGQTVLHKPPSSTAQGTTRQLGDGALMANLLGTPVVNDFRSADMRSGGQGAPLSAIYHRALLEKLGTTGDTAVLNLGGVANITWWDGQDALIAFDTGPANAPINDFVRQHSSDAYDVDGRLAAGGEVDEKRLAELLSHPYLKAPYPKSLDRFDFPSGMAEGFSLADGAALLTAFAAAAVGCALAQLPHKPTRVIVCGGGRHNHSLMLALNERAGASFEPAEAVGWRGDAMEAECFAYLGMRAIKTLPSSFPSTTGVCEPTSAGVLHRPAG